MKRTVYLTLLFLLLTRHVGAQVSISYDGSPPDSSAMLDVNSTSRGLLTPRMTMAQISAISNPADGLIVYCTTDSKMYLFAATVGQWKEVAYSSGTIIPPFSCGIAITVNHIAGNVAPVTKTVSYGTVTNIPGEPSKCWITSNLGADHQADSVNDTTEASAGWYWQFNRMQGYKHDGTTLSPSWTINGINENSDWITANDPCSIELGTGWRLPTSTEWTNVDAAGPWTNWNGPWNSALKMHAAGRLYPNNGSLLERGSAGHYRSTTQNSNTGGWRLSFNSSLCNIANSIKAGGFTARCLYCLNPESPVEGSHVPSDEQIIWNWNAVPDATGYKWNTVDNYTSAEDMGTSVTKTESGLNCGTEYTRYVWAYNDCWYSTPVPLTQSTPGCLWTCGDSSITIIHVAGNVAPVNKTVTYGTVTNIPGETSKCWITSNLGADHQADSVNDATEASAGWYWQFNRMQGYKHDGTTLTPAWTITTIEEESSWLIANDPCAIELGSGWRLPTYFEWINVDGSGSWTNWNGPWNSALKMHAAGYLHNSNGSLIGRGSTANYWNIFGSSPNEGWGLFFDISSCYVISSFYKPKGLSVRCIKD